MLKIILFLFVFISGCFNKVEVTLKPRASKSITSVSVINNQIKVTGSNLTNITTLKIKNGGLDETFTVESATATEVIANAGHAVTIGVGQLFDLILNSAEGAAIFPVSFSNTNGSITAVMLSSMGASTGQFLKFNGTTWIPSSITSSQTYKGTWNANTNSPDLNIVSPIAGDYYIVTTAGTQGAVTYAVGDYIISNGTVWSKLTNSISFNGRTGAVVPTAGDYTWSQITKTGSKIQDIADVDMTGVAAGKVLKWNGTNWIMGTDNGGGTPTAGSVTDLEIAAGANIAQSKIQNLTTDLAGKEPAIAAQATTKYFRGDKTFVTLDTSVVPENTNLYFTNARVLGLALTGFSANNAVITAADTVLSAFGKVQGQINNLASGSPNYLVKNSTDSITGVVNVGTIGLLQLNYVPVGLTDAVNKQYVDTAIGGGGSWSAGTGGNVGDVYRATGKVGIGTSAPTNSLSFSGTTSNQIGMERHSTADSSGNSLTIISGGATTGATNKSGGDLVLSSGASTGQASSNIIFKTSPVGALGTADNLPATRVSIDGFGRTSIVSDDPNPFGNNSPILTLSNIHTKFEIGNYGGISRFATSRADGFTESTLYMTGSAVSSDMQGLQIQTDNLNISNNGTSTFYISGGNLVGVGNSSPVAKLDVGGGIKIGADAGGCSAGRAGTMKFTSPNFEYCDGSSWVTFSTGSGAVTSANITDGTIVDADINASAAIAQSKIANLTTDLAAKEPAITAGSAAQYLKGNKTLGTFLTDVMAQVLTGISFATNSAITAADNMLAAFGKLQAQLNNRLINTAATSDTLASNVTLTGSITVSGAGDILIPLAPPTATSAVNKTYVDNNGVWTVVSGNATRTSGNVGVGLSSPTANFHVKQNATDEAFKVSKSDGSTIMNVDWAGRIFMDTTVNSTVPMLTVGNGNFGGRLLVLNGKNGNTSNLLEVKHDSVDKMLVTYDGKVGIGTSSPSTLLEISDSTTSPKLTLNNIRGVADKSNIIYFNKTGVNQWGIANDLSQTGAQNFQIRDFIASATRFFIDSSGNIGIGTTSPVSKLDVRGTISGMPAVSNGTATIDYSAGNIQYTTGNCGSFQFNNLKDGASYTFVVQGATSATCSFTAYTGAGTGALTVHLPSDHAATTVSKHTIYSMIVAGSHIYIAWLPGL